MRSAIDVWEEAFGTWDDTPTNPSRISDADEAAAAVIQSYGDEREAKGRAEAVAEVVKWLREQDGHGYDDMRANCIEAGEHGK